MGGYIRVDQLLPFLRGLGVPIEERFVRARRVGAPRAPQVPRGPYVPIPPYRVENGVIFDGRHKIMGRMPSAKRRVQVQPVNPRTVDMEDVKVGDLIRFANEGDAGTEGAWLRVTSIQREPGRDGSERFRFAGVRQEAGRTWPHTIAGRPEWAQIRVADAVVAKPPQRSATKAASAAAPKAPAAKRAPRKAATGATSLPPQRWSEDTLRPRYEPGRGTGPTPQSDPSRFADDEVMDEIMYLARLDDTDPRGPSDARLAARAKLWVELHQRAERRQAHVDRQPPGPDAPMPERVAYLREVAMRDRVSKTGVIKAMQARSFRELLDIAEAGGWADTSPAWRNDPSKLSRATLTKAREILARRIMSRRWPTDPPAVQQPTVTDAAPLVAKLREQFKALEPQPARYFGDSLAGQIESYDLPEPGSKKFSRLPRADRAAATALLEALQERADNLSQVENYRAYVRLIQREIDRGDLAPEVVDRLRQEQTIARTGIRLAEDMFEELDAKVEFRALQWAHPGQGVDLDDLDYRVADWIEQHEPGWAGVLV